MKTPFKYNIILLYKQNKQKSSKKKKIQFYAVFSFGNKNELPVAKWYINKIQKQIAKSKFVTKVDPPFSSQRKSKNKTINSCMK